MQTRTFRRDHNCDCDWMAIAIAIARIATEMEMKMEIANEWSQLREFKLKFGAEFEEKLYYSCDDELVMTAIVN